MFLIFLEIRIVMRYVCNLSYRSFVFSYIYMYNFTNFYFYFVIPPIWIINYKYLLKVQQNNELYRYIVLIKCLVFAPQNSQSYFFDGILLWHILRIMVANILFKKKYSTCGRLSAGKRCANSVLILVNTLLNCSHILIYGVYNDYILYL